MNLDRPVQFQRRALVDNGLNQTEVWANHGPVHMAAMRDLSDGERWRAGETQAHITTRFVLRYSPFTADIDPRDRLVCEGVTYEIVGAKDGAGRRQSREFTCARRNDTGA